MCERTFRWCQTPLAPFQFVRDSSSRESLGETFFDPFRKSVRGISTPALADAEFRGLEQQALLPVKPTSKNTKRLFCEPQSTLSRAPTAVDDVSPVTLSRPPRRPRALWGKACAGRRREEWRDGHEGRVAQRPRRSCNSQVSSRGFFFVGENRLVKGVRFTRTHISEFGRVCLCVTVPTYSPKVVLYVGSPENTLHRHPLESSPDSTQSHPRAFPNTSRRLLTRIIYSRAFETLRKLGSASAGPPRASATAPCASSCAHERVSKKKKSRNVCANTSSERRSNTHALEYSLFGTRDRHHRTRVFFCRLKKGLFPTANAGLRRGAAGEREQLERATQPVPARGRIRKGSLFFLSIRTRKGLASEAARRAPPSRASSCTGAATQQRGRQRPRISAACATAFSFTRECC